MAKLFNIKNNTLLNCFTFMLLFCFTTRAENHASTSTVVCNDNNIPYKSACELLISSLKANESSPIPVSKELFDHYVRFSFNHVNSFLTLSNSYQTTYADESMAYYDCMELLQDSLDQLANVISRKNKPAYTKNDVQTWLSAALTNQHTCIDSLRNGVSNVENEQVILMATNLGQHISNALSLYVSHYMKQDKNIGGRKLLSNTGFPSWISTSDRKLLETPVSEIEADAVVAKDGNGTHMTIMEAIDMVTKNILEGNSSNDNVIGHRNVIHVKAGIYHENVKIVTKVKNVMLIGDGKDKTVIVANRNADDGWSTFQSATVAATGDGFMAKGITFMNNAGQSKHQAVALRVGSDKSVIYQCSIQGYQDSLYTHSKRQFYRDSDIHGTVDFIFGNSAVVLQNCNIYPRNSQYRNFVTAQGRIDPNQNTGIVIHNCTISGGLPQSTYLGRPWKEYSRTVIIQSFLDGSINPAGWYPWTGNFALDTLYYAEYMNSGPGSSTSGRVKWGGYHGYLTPALAETFTVGNFIQGNTWLPSAGVPFNSKLND